MITLWVLKRFVRTYHFTCYVHPAEASWLSSPVDNLYLVWSSCGFRRCCMQGGRTSFMTFVLDYQQLISTFMFWRHQATLQEESLSSSWGSPGSIRWCPLFRETIGRTDLPTGNATQLLSSIREELLPFHLPTLSIPVMALKLLLVTRRCSIPS